MANEFSRFFLTISINLASESLVSKARQRYEEPIFCIFNYLVTDSE